MSWIHCNISIIKRCGKKQQLIRDIQNYWEQQEKPRVTDVAETFGLSQQTAKKYIFMSEEDITSLEHPNNYKKRESSMNAWLNVIYKMMADGCSNEVIYFYIKRQEAFRDSDRKLADYIYNYWEEQLSRSDPV